MRTSFNFVLALSSILGCKNVMRGNVRRVGASIGLSTSFIGREITLYSYHVAVREP